MRRTGIWWHLSCPACIGETGNAITRDIPTRDWECIPTPGHTPGHVAFFHKSDRVLITGDACLTVDIDSFWDLLRNKQSIARPPSVATWNWQAAKASVAALARVEPRVLASGHGIPMTGAGTARDLHAFADRFSGGATTGEGR
jgi:glyoxylase-like metal-dependent hydrolase (beta-lactamase superfamily II)